MRFFILAAVYGIASAAPFVARQNNNNIPTPEQIAALAPDLGAFPNTNPNQFGDCDGPPQANGQIPRVPCQCPPLHDAYIQALTANVLAGHAVNNTVVKVTFPTGDSVQDKHGRLTAAVISLQNLNGSGKGCPGVSTTLGIQSNNLDRCGDFQCGDSTSPAASSALTSSSIAASSTSATTTSSPVNVAPAVTTTPPPPANPTDQDAISTVTVTIHTVVTSIVTVTAGEEGATSTPAVATATSTTTAAGVDTTTEATSTTTAAASSSTSNGVISRELVDQLAPDLGSHPNNNPNRFGDCDGPVQPNGQIQRVPCACPPTRDDFITALLADIEAGHAVHNPSVKLTFPTGNSKADQHARLTASTIVLQNLHGPGQGCPNSSTTFAAQSNAIDN